MTGDLLYMVRFSPLTCDFVSWLLSAVIRYPEEFTLRDRQLIDTELRHRFFNAT